MYKLSALFAATSFLLPGCASDEDSDPVECRNDKCDGLDLPEDQVPATPCDGIMVDKSGRGFGTGKIAGRLNDPLANLVFKKGDSCPTGFTDIMKKLQDNAAGDAETSCDVAGGRRSMAVSETAQVLNMPTNYRMVTAVDCTQKTDTPPPGFGNPPGILFSLFGIRPTGALPDNVEIIALDATQGVFNYYETAPGGQINFFGTSRDMLKGTGSDDDRRCAGCHVGGGLIMKELAAPWLHWEGDTTTPGAQALVDAHADLLGRKSDGIDLETQVVRPGNDRWNDARLAFLRQVGDLREMLRPLYCNVEVNIGNASSSPQSGDEGTVSFAPLGGPVVDTRLGFGSLSFDAAAYDAVLRANKQKVASTATGIIETHFGLAHITPSDADINFVGKLQAAGIVDQEYIEDVLAVDFTRAVFSDDRCELLEFVPQIPAADLTAAAVREGTIEKLLAASPVEGTPARELLNNLLNPADTMSERVGTFEQACQARLTENVSISFTSKAGAPETRQVPAALVDYMKVIALYRDQARQLQVFEFPQTMPDDSQSVAAGSRLDPETCQVTTAFVAVAPNIDPERSCVGRCGEVQDGAECQCDDGCEAAGNCCDDFVALCTIPECAHSVCAEGAALPANCTDPELDGSTCAAQVCAQDAFCCQSNWDATCVQEAQSICGVSCDGIGGGGGGGNPECCVTCTNSQACGDSCIGIGLDCNQPAGCACQN